MLHKMVQRFEPVDEIPVIVAIPVQPNKWYSGYLHVALFLLNLGIL